MKAYSQLSERNGVLNPVVGCGECWPIHVQVLSLLFAATDGAESGESDGGSRDFERDEAEDSLAENTRQLQARSSSSYDVIVRYQRERDGIHPWKRSLCESSIPWIRQGNFSFF